MAGKLNPPEETDATPWKTAKAQVLLPPCERVPVTCSYTLSTDAKSYVGFIKGRLGQFIRLRSPLTIYWARGIVCCVLITSFSDQSVSFRVACEDWALEEPSARSLSVDDEASRRGG